MEEKMNTLIKDGGFENIVAQAQLYSLEVLLDIRDLLALQEKPYPHIKLSNPAPKEAKIDL